METWLQTELHPLPVPLLSQRLGGSVPKGAPSRGPVAHGETEALWQCHSMVTAQGWLQLCRRFFCCLWMCHLLLWHPGVALRCIDEWCCAAAEMEKDDPENGMVDLPQAAPCSQ